MEINKMGASIVEFLKKYRYVALILFIGIALMLIPGTNKTKISENQTETILDEKEEVSIAEELEAILTHMDGAGAVKVMVTTARGQHTLYQTDTNTVQTGSEQTEKIETVLITDSEKNQSGLVTRVDPPQYLGVIVLCQGADSAAVRLAIVDAVAKITGLGTDCISVLKMK